MRRQIPISTIALAGLLAGTPACGTDPRPQYARHGDVIEDRGTGSFWEAAPDPNPFTWFDAQARCDALTTAGEGDWRLPTRGELLALELAYMPFDVELGFVWTATSNATTPDLAAFCRIDAGYQECFCESGTTFTWELTLACPLRTEAQTAHQPPRAIHAWCVR